MVINRLADDNQQTNPINNLAFIDTEYNRAFIYDIVNALSCGVKAGDGCACVVVDGFIRDEFAERAATPANICDNGVNLRS